MGVTLSGDTAAEKEKAATEEWSVSVRMKDSSVYICDGGSMGSMEEKGGFSRKYEFNVFSNFSVEEVKAILVNGTVIKMKRQRQLLFCSIELVVEWCSFRYNR